MDSGKPIMIGINVKKVNQTLEVNSITTAFGFNGKIDASIPNIKFL
jgi:hypothetical protein